jgi:hypothetical protein
MLAGKCSRKKESEYDVQWYLHLIESARLSGLGEAVK